ncbi:MAG: translation elongation factor Ts [Oscillospiraceae bacterium]|nr:translation elongation factor Ts [Oscillospiraceae bacterium]
MAFTAADVKDLREKTGVGMMDCKKALVEADGDMDRAMDILRERGLAAATKKAGRITAEGIVAAYQENGVSVLVEVNSETDFVAKNAEFQAFALDVAKTIAANDPAGVDALLAMNLAGSDRSVEEIRQEKVFSIGENISIRRFTRIVGHAVSYIHGGGSMGVLVEFKADPAVAATEAFAEMGRNVAMQAAAMNPQYLSEAAVPAEVVENEKRILGVQLAEDEKMKNKPQKVLDGIVTGRIAKFYKEVCLLEQPYVKDGDLSVAQYIAGVAKELGGAVEALGFIRYVKGENMQKREDDFAAEVAKAAGQA